MRTYLNRLTMTAAVALLSGVSFAGVAHAGEGDDNPFLDPSVLEDMPSLERCHEITASEDIMLFPLDPHPPLPAGQIELVPCFPLPAAPGDEDDDDDGDGGGDDGGDDGNGDGDGGHGPGGDNGGDGDGGNSGGGVDRQSGYGSGGSKDQSDGEPSDGVADEGFGETADDRTSQSQETVTPTAASGDAGDGALMLAVFAGVLGALSLFLLTYGLRKRPRRGQLPAR